MCKGKFSNLTCQKGFLFCHVNQKKMYKYLNEKSVAQPELLMNESGTQMMINGSLKPAVLYCILGSQYQRTYASNHK